MTMLSVENASIRLGCTSQYVRKLVREGKILAERVGNSWVIPESAVANINTKKQKMANTRSADRIGKRKRSRIKLNALSFFSGAMGLDIGLEKAGINLLLACEIDEASRQTILTNDEQVGLIGNILDYDVPTILNFANVKSASEIDLIVGGPPCQAFSTAGKREGFADSRGNVFLKFIDLIAEIRPKYAVIENVRGLLSVPMTIEISDNITSLFAFDPKKTAGSALFYVKRKLEAIGYNVSFNLYNSANYAVPQIRERVIIICSLQNGKVPYLMPTRSNEERFGLPAWETFSQAVQNMEDLDCDHVKFPKKRLKFIKMLQAGQNWRDLPEKIQPEAMGKSFLLGGGKTGFYRRLSWDKPAPTLVTHPAMPATELAHPEEHRPISVQEYKRIQQFPDEWKLQGSIIDKYKQVGNAVPVKLGEAIGRTIIEHYNGKIKKRPEDFPYSRYKNTNDVDWEKSFLTAGKKLKKP